MLHQFKIFAGGRDTCTVYSIARSNLAPTASPVFLQIYNQSTSLWETIASNNSTASDVDFELTDTITDLTNYKDVQGIVSCRVYQLAI